MFMKTRWLIRGILGSLLPLMGAAPVALRAAIPPSITASAERAGATNTPDASGNPYAVIVERNVFRLNPIPPPPEPVKAKPDLPKVKITGFINLGGRDKVLFVAEPKDKKDGPLYYTLAEGERSGDGKLELVKIHPGQDAVDIINDGTPATLTTKDDTLAPASAPTTPGESKENQPPGHRGMAGRPGFNGGGPPGFNGIQLPGRARRTPPHP